MRLSPSGFASLLMPGNPSTATGSPLYTQKLEEAEQRGEKQRQKKLVENLLKSRFGSLDEQLSAIIEPLLSLPTEEFTPLLLQLSREELIERFPKR